MMLKRCNSIVLIAMLVVGVTARAQSVSVLLQKGVYQEETAGDLNAAIKTYEKLVADEKANRPHVAQATYRLGMCYLKQGQQQQAVETFEKLITEFPRQALLIERARGALSVLGQVAMSDGAAKTPSRLLGTYPSPPGYPRTLAMSPDGRSFVFADGESASLVVRDLRTGQDRQLTQIAIPVDTTTPAGRSFSQRSGQSLTISPDGKWVAYNLFDKEDETAELRIIGVDGSRERVVFDPKEQVRWISPKDWSRDGKHIVGRLERSDGTAGIVMVSVSDGTVKELKSVPEWDANHLSLSPDGRYIAYNFYLDDSEWMDIALLPIDGSPQTPVTEHPGHDILMGWAPDGRTVLFLSDRGDTEDNVWAIQILDGKPQGLPQRVNAVAGAEGQFTQDGSYYYPYRDKVGLHQSVYTATLDPESGRLVSHPEKVSKRVDRITGGSGWSRDGKHLAYGAKPVGSRGGPHWIVIREIKTGQEREITLKTEFRSMADWGTMPWSPDGRSLFFVGGERRNKTGVCRLDVKTGEVTFAVQPKDGEEILLLGLAPDGKSFFFGRVKDETGNRGYMGGRILVKNLETGQEKELYGETAGGGGALSPDGELLAVKSPLSPNQKSLLAIPTSGGAPQEVLRLEKTGQLGYAVCWTPDGRHLLFAKREHSSGKRKLLRIPAQGGQSEEVGLAFAELLGVQFHPNGRQITFTGWPRPEMELRVLENFVPELTPLPTPNPPEGNYFITRSEDDAEELGKGEMVLESHDLDLGDYENDLESSFLVGLRYTGLPIPNGSKIKKAYLQFTSDATGDEPIQTDLTIHAELATEAKTFTKAKHNISSRGRTKAFVKWNPASWEGLGERSKKQQTPSLSSLVQELVAQDDWRKGNSLVFIITGSGERDAMSFDGSGRRYAPMLHVEFE